MAVGHRRGALASDDRLAEAEGRLAAAGLSPRTWGNAPGDTYAPHDHARHKILFCTDGAITFHTDEGDVAMEAGDRLDLPPGTQHSATVGDAGCTCIEAFTDAPRDV